MAADGGTSGGDAVCLKYLGDSNGICRRPEGHPLVMEDGIGCSRRMIHSDIAMVAGRTAARQAVLVERERIVEILKSRGLLETVEELIATGEWLA